MVWHQLAGAAGHVMCLWVIVVMILVVVANAWRLTARRVFASACISACHNTLVCKPLVMVAPTDTTNSLTNTAAAAALT